MKNKRVWLPVLLQSLAFTGLLLFSISQYYPTVGMDYKYFIPRLLDSDLHYRINGLSIQWYTPSFGGGLPSYPNPQQIQFSLPQFFTIFVNPWLASLISIAFFVLAGMVGSFILAHHTLKMDVWASALFASFFMVNGFYIQHMGIGHLTFMTFPLLPWLILGLIHRKSAYFNGILLSLVFATLLYGGGFYPIVYFVFSAMLSLPLIFAFYPALFDLSSLLKNIGWGLFFTLLLNASKLSAVLYFLRNFPRVLADEFNTTLFQSLKSIPYQLLGSMSLAPYGLITGKNPKYTWETLMSLTGSNLPSWELDISISPILILFLIAGLGHLLWKLATQKPKVGLIQVISVLFFILFFEITVEFITIKGIFYPYLSQLPILKSLHVNPRYTAVLIFPLALGGAFSVQTFFEKFSVTVKNKLFTWLISTFLILAFASVYLLLPMDTLQRRQFNIEGSLDIYNQIIAGQRFPVLNIQDNLNDARVFDQNSSTLTPYEVLFGYGMREFKPNLIVGPVDQIREEHYNLNNPSGFVFGEVNGSLPFDRIKTTDKVNFEKFIRREKTDWKLPNLQHIANVISVVTVLIILISVGYKQVKQQNKLN